PPRRNPLAAGARSVSNEEVAMGQIVKVGQTEIRYLVDSAQTGGLGLSEIKVPPGARVPPPHSHSGNASVALRQIRPGDADALQGFVRALSPASRRMRFHAALNELSESSLRALTCADQRGHVAFVLTGMEHGTERIVGE